LRIRFLLSYQINIFNTLIIASRFEKLSEFLPRISGMTDDVLLIHCLLLSALLFWIQAAGSVLRLHCFKIYSKVYSIH